MRIIRISAALIVRADGKILLVRKRGTTAFMQPGGKIEPGESPAAALVRELEEEIGLRASPEQFRSLGRFEATAANEPDHLVSADVFVFESGDRIVAPAAEIEEIRWISPIDPADIVLAELTEHHILPAWRQTLLGT
ncbi:NUDIX hydrolase [Neorhizobium petrolearium]|uniref:NUDIX domain-containing protein n=1 Tax=Neorhizobium petrolearium TaxID=515361 RepID=A0ABY8M2U4_9HYPH|nr:NUDIX domain-containing protein [Neorhizobium petrolearium]MCC2608603.1 NUDIX domain-containing protein [Neorhizobium petrolearium]WGI68867.1 NUDIX domain-containing protein [Neorhizobium petrolearium]